jgi:hypothetical protein
LQRVRGIIAATLVGLPLSAFLWFWLHAPIEVAILISVVLGVAVFAIVASRSDAHDDASDVAWKLAAPDLPPTMDRTAMEREQMSMPGPEKPARSAAGRTRDGQPGARPVRSSSQGADPK